MMKIERSITILVFAEVTDDKKVAVDFGTLGLWVYNGFEKKWFQFSGLSPD